MSELETDLPPLKNAEKAVHLEVDTFCVECGYNLHGQPVTRDERLGIFVCRCPECGRFHPAGTGLTANRPWMNRLAMGFLILWVLIVLFAVFWIVMGLGVFGVLHTSEFVNRRFVTQDGSPTDWANVTTPGGGSGWRVVKKGTTQPVVNYRAVYTLEEVSDQTPWGFNNRRAHLDWWTLAGVTGLAAALGLVVGMLNVIFLWHWKRWGYRLALLLPFAVALALALVCYFSDEYQLIRWWAIRVVLGYAVLQTFFMAIGLKIGRPIARGVLRLVVPPRPRQHFAFLWKIDGKPMPLPPIAQSS